MIHTTFKIKKKHINDELETKPLELIRLMKSYHDSNKLVFFQSKKSTDETEEVIISVWRSKEVYLEYILTPLVLDFNRKIRDQISNYGMDTEFSIIEI